MGENGETWDWDFWAFSSLSSMMDPEANERSIVDLKF